jgi:hypothetical protein
MDLERELKRLVQDEVELREELPVEGEWSEWSPVPFGKPAEDAANTTADEPLEFADVGWRRRAA